MENKHVMNWVTIDIGAADVKASVWNKNDEPVRLAYPMGSYTTTQLSAAVVVTENGDVVAGDNVQLFSILYPDRLISDWMKNMRYKEKVAESLLGMVRQAAVGHYGNANVGAVILFEDGEDSVIMEMARKIFAEVQSFCTPKVIAKITSPTEDCLTLIVDFAETALKISVVEKEMLLSFSQNQDLSFSNISMGDLINDDFYDGLDVTRQMVFANILKKVKAALNKNEAFVLPNEVPIEERTLRENFAKNVTGYFGKCFEECSGIISQLKKSWDDVGNVVFVGGGADSHWIDTAFERFMQNRDCQLRSYNSRNAGFDAQYASTYCAIQLPLRRKERIIIKY